MITPAERELLNRIKQGDPGALRDLYDTHYSRLCQQVYLMIWDRPAAEDIVQELFIELWQKRDRLEVQTALRPYLKRWARNRTLNYLRTQRIAGTDIDELAPSADSAYNPQEGLEYTERQQDVERAIAELPERCRIVFTLSRYEAMSYKEIAESLQISVKTVENQMTKALRVLRKKLCST